MNPRSWFNQLLLLFILGILSYPSAGWARSSDPIQLKTSFFCEVALMKVDLGHSSSAEATYWFDWFQGRTELHGQVIFELIENGHLQADPSTEGRFLSSDGTLAVEFWQRPSGIRGFTLHFLQVGQELQFIQEEDLDEGSPFWSS